MAKSRYLTGFRHRLIEPFDWTLRHDKRAVFYRIEVVNTNVSTPDGQMLMVRLNKIAELANPSVDVAVLVGQVKAYRKSGVVDPQAPELWFWNDKFWCKAKDADGVPYYNNQAYLIYEVSVRRSDELLGQLKFDVQ